MENKTKLIIRRPNEWQNRARVYKVLIDEVEAGNIKNNSSEEFSTNPGIHRIQCRISWYGSAVFQVDLKPGQVEYILVKNGMKYYWPLFLLLTAGIAINLFYIGHEDEKPLWATLLQLLLILPALLYMLFYLTVGRNRYIVLEEDRDNIFAA
ncbi:MAG TPA: hypothetical protein VK543_19715 [Puia sp.]|nr:hypothetical protein [Puia sp.]